MKYNHQSTLAILTACVLVFLNEVQLGIWLAILAIYLKD